MSPSGVLIVTWLLAIIVVGLYIWFMVWRVRVDRRKKAAAAGTAARMSSAIEKAARLAAELPDERPAVTAPDRAVESAVMPATAAVGVDATVAGALAGIHLPNDLAPLTTLADRPGTADRVAFWTNTAPVEVVGPAFTDELERLGYTVSNVDPQSLSAQRDGRWVRAIVHPDGRAATIGDRPAFESVPERAVVVEVWLPE